MSRITESYRNQSRGLKMYDQNMDYTFRYHNNMLGLYRNKKFFRSILTHDDSIDPVPEIYNRIENLENNETVFQIFEYIGVNTTGTVAIPENATIFDIYNDGVIDAYLVEADDQQKPTETASTEDTGSIVFVDSFSNTGEYVLSDIPTANSCIIYFIKISDKYKSNIDQNLLITAGLPISSNPYGLITAGGSNADYISLKDAIDAANSYASATNPFVVQAFGYFTEDPMELGPYVTLHGCNTVIVPNDQNNPLFTLNMSSEIWGCRIQGPTNSYAVYSNAYFSSFKNGAIINTGYNGFYVGSGSYMVIRDTTVSGPTNIGFHADGGTLIMTNIAVQSVNTMVYADNSSRVIMSGFASNQDTVWDLYQADALSVFTVNNCNISEDKLYFTDVSTSQISIVSNKENDRSLLNIQELRCGIPEKGFEAVFGEGDSYTRGMLVYTEDTSGVFTNVSTAAASASASTFTFTGTAANNSIYIASSLSSLSDKLMHYGIKTNVNTAADFGTGNIIAEFYNGSSWKEFTIGETESSGEYFPHANNIFQHTGNHHVRYNVRIGATTFNWTKNDPMLLGTDYYWIRFRIETAITTSPIFEQFKLHTSRFEANEDGWVEYFGNARPIAQLPVSLTSAKPFEGNMQSQTIYINQDLAVGFTNNRITASADKTGILGFLPFDCDTSSPINMQWSCNFSDTQTVVFTIRLGWVTQDDLYYTTEPSLGDNINTYTVSKSVTAGNVEMLDVYMDVSSLVSRRENHFGDQFFISLQATTMSGTIDLVGSQILYIKWCDGGHI